MPSGASYSPQGPTSSLRKPYPSSTTKSLPSFSRRPLPKSTTTVSNPSVLTRQLASSQRKITLSSLQAGSSPVRSSSRARNFHVPLPMSTSTPSSNNTTHRSISLRNRRKNSCKKHLRLMTLMLAKQCNVSAITMCLTRP